MTRFALLPLFILAVACSAASDNEQAGAEGDAAAAPAATEPRIARAPTPPDSLPAAILGTAPPPGGTAVQYVSGDSAARGYLAVPEGAGPFPAVILVHEWNGLVDRVKQIADALAAEGYVALAADLFSGRIGSNPEENMTLVRAALADEPRMIANLNAAAAYLRARPDITGKIGVMGWCFGGGVALSYGLNGEEHDATAIFYGRLVDDPARLASLHHEVYGTFAALDQGPSPADVERFAAALREAGVPNDLHVYDAVNHAFWLYVDEEPAVRRAPALDAWQRLKAYLTRTLS